jgi:hypothetical protein
MIMGWNYKSEKASWWLFFFLPLIPSIAVVFFGPLFPFVHRYPVLSGFLFGVLFVLGFIVIWKRTGKKDKKE